MGYQVYQRVWNKVNEANIPEYHAHKIKMQEDGTIDPKSAAQLIKDAGDLVNTLYDIYNNDEYPPEFQEAAAAVAMASMMGGYFQQELAQELLDQSIAILEQYDGELKDLSERYPNMVSYTGEGTFVLPWNTEEKPIADVFPPADINPLTGETYTESPPIVVDTPDVIQDIAEAFGASKSLGSPLVLDLDGDGVELAALSGSDAIYWDIDQDGYAEASGWIAGGDGLLAIDLDSDGYINDHGELFGTLDTDGFTILSSYDTNLDGYITNADLQWSDLVVWIDGNQNGVSENGELSTLDSLGITSISVNATLVDYDISGNHITHESTFTMNGQTQSIVDAWFSYDNVNTVYVEDYVFSDSAIYLPTIRGFGETPDLHIAMSVDGSLMAMVEEITFEESEIILSDVFDLKGKMEQIIYRWTGVDNVDPTSRGDYVDAQKLEALETFLGDEFLRFDSPGDTDPGPDQAVAIEKAFDKLLGYLTNSLLVQTAVSDLYPEGTKYNFITGELEGETASVVNFVDSSVSFVSATNDSEILLINDLTQSYDIEESGGENDVIWLAGVDPSAIRFENAVSLGGLRIHYGSESIFIYDQFDDQSTGVIDPTKRIETLVLDNGVRYDLSGTITFTGTESGETMNGVQNQSDILIGLGGNDVINGYQGNDKIYGGDGYDTLTGAAGADTFVFEAASAFNDIDFVDDFDASENDAIDLTDILGSVFVHGVSDINDYVRTVAYGGGSHLQVDQDGGADNFVSIAELRYFTPQSDLQSLVDNGSLLINEAGNSEPTANADAFTVDEDSVLTGNVLVDNGSNADEDADGDTLFVKAESITTANGATVSISSDGSFSYTLVADFNGSDSFEYILLDGKGGRDIGEAVIDVLPVNDNPDAVDDSIVGSQDIAFTANVLASNGNGADSDIDGDAISVVAGIITTANGIDIVMSANGDFTYTPSAGFYGTDSFVYTVEDGVGGSSQATVNIVIEQNIAPTANDDLFNGTQDQTITGNVLANDVDTDGDSFIAVAQTLTTANGGQVDLQADGNFSYTPDNGFSGQDSFTYSIVDARGATSLATVTINITGLTTIDGTTGNNTIHGTSDNELISGLAGSDYLYGHDGFDTLVGGTESDYLYGGTGNDTYAFEAGDGTDQVYETVGEGSDVIHMSGGLTLSDLQIYTNSSGHMFIRNTVNTSDQITVNAAKTASGASRVGEYVEKIVFDDGSELDLTNGLYLNDRDTANYYMHGSIYGDVMYGNGGNDYLYGHEGNDILAGGISSDYIYGGTGDDTFVFEAGDGTDQVYETVGEGSDVIHMSGGLTLSDLQIYTNSSGHMFIRNTVNTSDQITVNASKTASGATRVGEHVEKIVFDDGSELDLTNGLYLNDRDTANYYMHGSIYGDVMYGNGGNDYLYGHEGDDLLSGGISSDYLYGGTGNDTFVFEAGDGTDQVYETVGEGSDVIHMSGGLTLSDLQIYTNNSGHMFIRNTVNTSDQITVNASKTASGASRIGEHVEKIVFDDGSELDLTNGLYLNDRDTANYYMHGSVYGDEIHGNGGNDYLYGHEGDDLLVGGAGTDYIYGNEGADTFLFETDTAFGAFDNIYDFSTSENDALDIADLLVGYDAAQSAIDDFVSLTVSGSNTSVYVDRDGTASTYSMQKIATLSSVTGLDADDMLTNGHLIAA